MRYLVLGFGCYSVDCLINFCLSKAGLYPGDVSGVVVDQDQGRVGRVSVPEYQY